MKKTYVIDGVSNDKGYIVASLYPLSEDDDRYQWIPASPIILHLPNTVRNAKRFGLNKIVGITIRFTGQTVD